MCARKARNPNVPVHAFARMTITNGHSTQPSLGQSIRTIVPKASYHLVGSHFESLQNLSMEVYACMPA